MLDTKNSSTGTFNNICHELFRHIFVSFLKIILGWLNSPVISLNCRGMSLKIWRTTLYFMCACIYSEAVRIQFFRSAVFITPSMATSKFSKRSLSSLAISASSEIGTISVSDCKPSFYYINSANIKHDTAAYVKLNLKY